MSGWSRYFALKIQVHAGFSPGIVIWALIAAVSTAAMFCFLCVAAFQWLAARYGPVTAGLVLAGFFLLLALIALVACLMTRRSNIEQARLELAARAASPGGGWIDPRLVTTGFQIAQSIGWRRLASLAAVGVLAAGLTKEWFGREQERPEGDDASSDS